MGPIVTQLATAFDGRVTVMGRDLASWGADYYQRVGVSFELPNYFTKLTALENLTYFGALYARKGRPPLDLLKMVGLGDSADRKRGRHRHR